MNKAEHMLPGPDMRAGVHSALESRAIELALNLSVDGALTETIHQLSEAEAGGASPWLLCYQAMERRLSQGDYAGTLKLAQEAAARFERLADRDGYARALAETVIARYHFGQYALALVLQRNFRPVILSRSEESLVSISAETLRCGSG